MTAFQAMSMADQHMGGTGRQHKFEKTGQSAMSGISALSNSNFSGESRILNEATQAILDFERY